MTNQIAHTILAQLGGNRFLAMTGAKCSADTKTLIVKLPRSKVVTITLDDSDTYTVKTGRLASMKEVFSGKPAVVWKNEESFIYADQLQAIFTAHTGLATHL